MRKYVYIGIGGFIGAILRFVIKNINIYNYKENIPLNTLIINVTGSFLLALITVTAMEVRKMDESVRLGICTGFLGAYTTFSTLCKETVVLFSKGYYFSAISYITDSIILGLAAAYFGVIAAREYVPRLLNKYNDNVDKLKGEAE